jgi:hypothetical protein
MVRTISGNDRKELQGRDKRARLNSMEFEKSIMWFKVLLPIHVPQTLR